jgi:hypothetical protein
MEWVGREKDIWGMGSRWSVIIDWLDLFNTEKLQHDFAGGKVAEIRLCGNVGMLAKPPASREVGRFNKTLIRVAGRSLLMAAAVSVSAGAVEGH